VDEWDFLLMNPRLPRMAQVLCLYAIVVDPAWWLLSNLLCLAKLPPEPSGSRFTFMLDALAALLSLAMTVLMLIGGVRLRALRPSGARLICITIWISLGLGVLLFLTYAIYGLAFAISEPQSPPDSIAKQVLDVLEIFVGIALGVFEIIALVWLTRNRARLEPILIPESS
jgi:hypothetical protein